MRAALARAAACCAALLAATPAFAADAAGTLVAARTVRAGELVVASDLAPGPETVPGALSEPADAVGMEARVTLVKGRPVTPQDLAPPALVERNQIVTMSYVRGALTIMADGRALARAALGERVRVMNLDSRATVTATVSGPGQVEIR